MNIEDALQWLARHQPMPPDRALSEETIRQYDEIRKLCLKERDDRCVRLFLNSFGEGDGFGVYQLIEDVIRQYPEELVVSELDRALESPHQGVRNWSLQIAMEHPDRRLARHFRQSLKSTDLDERTWASLSLESVFDPADSADRKAVEEALQTEVDPEIRATLERLKPGA